MDPIETYIANVIGINIAGHKDMYELSNSFGAAPVSSTKIDPALNGDPMSRLKWSRYNVLLCFARARYYCIDVFRPLLNSSELPDGQMHFRRLTALLDFFRVIGTLLDSLAEEANVIYAFGIPKDKVTITYLRTKMADLQRTGSFASPQQTDFIAAILSTIQDPQFERIFQFRHLATHRPKLKWIPGDGRSMFLPVDPTLDPDNESLWSASSFQPKNCPADTDLIGMLSRISDLIDSWYVLTNRHFAEMYVKP